MPGMLMERLTARSYARLGDVDRFLMQSYLSLPGSKIQAQNNSKFRLT